MEGMRTPLVVLALVLLAGCGDDEGEPAGTAPAAPDVALEIRFDDGRGETSEASLQCGGGSPEATGYLEDADADAAELCERAVGLRELFTEEPPQRACTQIFGGPQTARVTGELSGATVDRRFSRENGCRIAEWDRLAVAGLLPAA